VSSQDFSPAPLPFFGEDGGGVFSISESRPRERYWLHFALFALTLATTTLVGAAMQYDFRHNQAFNIERTFTTSFYTWVFRNPVELLHGLPFSLTLMGILLAHEMGHFLYCVRYGVNATLPFFLPAPTLIGTFGAFIRIKSPIRSRSALFDIGIAGPIAGFVAASVTLCFAMMLTKPMPDSVAAIPQYEFGYPLVFYAVQALLVKLGVVAAAIPLGVAYLHPTAIAAWVGMFATALNLLPGGQLDGGHIVFSLFPRAHRAISRITMLALFCASWWWVGWLLWAVLLRISGMRHPQVGPEPSIGATRRALFLVALGMLALTFVLAPFKEGGFRDLFECVYAGDIQAQMVARQRVEHG
jgi:membrane-associated protease RseP (regulator of RpoE activity)